MVTNEDVIMRSAVCQWERVDEHVSRFRTVENVTIYFESDYSVMSQFVEMVIPRFPLLRESGEL